jgi:hypothetical protein
MNITIWDCPEEAVVYSILGAISFLIHLYILFLSSAIYDFQDEKPEEEKCHFDVLIKDLMSNIFWAAYTFGHIQFISLFTPSLNNDLVYCFSYLGVLICHFMVASILVTVYIHNVFVFQPDDIEGIMITTFRSKTRVSKFIVTLYLMFLSIMVPVQNEPLIFQWLNKGKTNYER